MGQFNQGNSKRVFFRLLSVLIPRILSAVFQAIALIIIAKSSDVSDFGLLMSVMGVLTFLSTFADLGMGPYILKTQTSDPGAVKVSTALRFSFACATISGLISYLGFLVLAMFQGSIWLRLSPLSIWVAGEIMLNSISLFYIALENTSNIVLAIAGRKTVSLALLLISVNMLNSPVFAFTLSLALGNMAIALFQIRRIPLAPKEDTGPGFLELFNESKHFSLNSIAMQAKNLDSFIVNIFAGTYMAGIYSLPSRIIGPLTLIPSALGQIALPIAAGQNKISHQKFRIIVSAFIFIWGIGLLLIGTFSHTLISFLGADFGKSVLPMQIACFGIFFAGPVSILVGFIQGLGLQKSVGYISAITNLYLVLSLAIGSTTHGAVGASIALASTYILQFVLFLILLSRFRARN